MPDPDQQKDEPKQNRKENRKETEWSFPKTILKKQERKLRARKNEGHHLWFGLGMFGLVGWSVSIPTLIGVFLGVWMDRMWPGRPSWTLTMLLVGICAGCWNAWFWVKRESRKGED